MKLGRGGRPKIGPGVAGGVLAQVHRKLESKIRGEIFFAAQQVSREAARIARNQIGANDRIVRGYKVGPSSTGYFSVYNDARGNNGRALGQPWEQGTGIHFRESMNTPAHGEMIKASRYGKKFFVWTVRANEQRKGTIFQDEGLAARPYSGDGPTFHGSTGQGRVRRDTKGRIRARRLNPGQTIWAKKIEGFPGTHALEKAGRNMAKVHGWKYTLGVRFR